MAKNKSSRTNRGHNGRVTTPKRELDAAAARAIAESGEELPAPAGASTGGNREQRRSDEGVAHLAIEQARVEQIAAGRTKRRLLLGLVVGLVLGLGIFGSVVLGAVGPVVATVTMIAGFALAAGVFTGRPEMTALALKGRWAVAALGVAGGIVDLTVTGSIIGALSAFAGGAVGWVAATVGTSQFKPVPPLPVGDRVLLEKLGAQVTEDATTGMSIASIAGGRNVAVTRIDLDGDDPRTNSDVMAFAARVDQVRRVLPDGLREAGVHFGGVCLSSGVPRPIRVAEGVWVTGAGNLGKAIEKATN